MQAFVDFDGVLFNIVAAKRAYFRVFSPFGVSEALAQDSYREMKEQIGHDEPAFHAQLLRKYMPKLDAGVLLSALTEFKTARSAEFVYRDARPFLEFLEQAGFDVHLVTTGSASLQPKKVAASGLERFFRSIRVLDSDLKGSAIGTMYAGEGVGIFIDDKHVAIDDVKRVAPRVAAVQVVRQQELVRSKAADAVVTTLVQARNHIRSMLRVRP